MWQRLFLATEERDHAIQLLRLDKGKDPGCCVLFFVFFPLLCIFLYIIQLHRKKITRDELCLIVRENSR